MRSSFSLQLPDGSRVSIDVDDMTDLSIAAGEAAAERSSGLLLAIDEVQYLESIELGALITAIHRTTQRDLPVVLVGAGLPQLRGLVGDAKSYAERLFEFSLMSSLDRDDTIAALRIPVQEMGVDYTDAALEAIIDRAHGYPYFLQEWGYHTWNHADDNPIGADLVERVVPDVLRHLDDNFFLVRFDRLTPAEKTYLRAMAELGPGPHRSGDIAAGLGVKVESVAPRRGGLIGKGMIFSPAHGDTAFTVPLFDEFLKRAME